MEEGFLFPVIILNEIKPDERQEKCGDIDGDGKLTIADLSSCKQFVSKKITSLGPKK